MNYHGVTGKALPPGAKRGWHQRKGPGRALHRLLHGHSSRLWRNGYDTAWMDHLYRYPLPTGEWAYVAEPYYLTDRDVLEIALLMLVGYDVVVSPNRALVNPGHTMAITIVPRDRGVA